MLIKYIGRRAIPRALLCLRHQGTKWRSGRKWIFLGFTSGLCGVFANKEDEKGLSIKISPHYSTSKSHQYNLRSMVVSLLMTDANGLSQEEKEILQGSIEFIYEPKSSDSNRRDWCDAELKNFMKCCEKFGDIQSSNCKGFQKLLHSCLHAKKFAPPLEPLPLSCQIQTHPCKEKQSLASTLDSKSGTRPNEPSQEKTSQSESNSTSFGQKSPKIEFQVTCGEWKNANF